MNEKPKKRLPKIVRIILGIVLVVVILFAALFIWALVDVIRNPSDKLPESTTEPTAQSSAPSPTPEPTPEPTPSPTPEPTPEPTPSPTPEPTPEPTKTPTPTPAPTTNPTPEPSSSTRMSISDCAKVSELVMQQNFGEDYNIKVDGNVVIYNVWKDGVTYGAVLALQGADAYKKMWDDMMDGVTSMASSIQKYYDDSCTESVVVNVNIVNDQNKDNILASILSGLVVYDSVNNIDLLG